MHANQKNNVRSKNRLGNPEFNLKHENIDVGFINDSWMVAHANVFSVYEQRTCYKLYLYRDTF